MAKKEMTPGKARKSAQTTGSKKLKISYLVSGRVTDRQSGRGLPGLKVEALDKDMRADQSLGAAVTNASGNYTITYTAGQFSDAEKRGADLIVRVLDRQGKLLGASRVRYNAPAKAKINLVVELSPEPEVSEYERLLAELKPLMKEVAFADLEDADIDFLSKEAGIPKVRIKMLRSAGRNAMDLLAPPELVYALLRKGLGGTATELAKYTPEQITTAVHAAVKEGIIGAIDAGALNRLLGRVAQIRADNDPLSHILEGTQVTGSAKAIKFLAAKGVRSLGELRSPAGFEAVQALEREQPGPAVDLLRAHVNLSVLAPDSQVRSVLLENNYRTVGEVVSSTVEEFVGITKGKLDPSTAITLHTQAVLMERFIKKNLLDAQLTGTRVVTGKDIGTTSFLIKTLHDSQSCACKDCESAVSPLAYLADLLKYCSDNLRDTGKPAGQQRVDYARLGQELRQKFADLPAECGAVEKQVHQVRIAIEVLRSYLAANPPAASAANTLALAERDYLRTAYEALLLHSGTNYTDLRLAVVAPDEALAALADRIGVRPPDGVTNRLGELLLDVSAAPLATFEGKLEELFGLKNTRQAPLAAIPVPKLLSWRRERLRDTWFAQDWPDDSPGPGEPIIDPDVIGPDDFRHPDAARGAFEIWARRRNWVDQQLSNLWQRTPVGAGSRLDLLLEAMYVAAGATALPAYPLRNGGSAPARTWPAATPKSSFLALSTILGSGDKTAVVNARDMLSRDFGLEVDAYNRLKALYEKDAAQRADPRNPMLAEAEVREFVSILAQARKRLHFSDWLGEEQASQRSTDPNVLFQFGPRDFWISLAEPEVGDWPPVDPDQRTPWIDPDLVKLTDLPDSAVGNAARALWASRKQVLATKLTDLHTARTGSFEQALVSALGAIPTGVLTWGAYLDDTLQKLGSAVQADLNDARQRLDQSIFLSEEAFRRLMVIRAKDGSIDPTQKPVAVEYDEVELILLGAYKRKSLYPTWRSDERGGLTPLSDWQALKIRLPQWRSSPEARAAWQSALRLRAKTALIDPDLVDDQHLAFAVSSIPAGAPAAGAKPAELAARFWRDRKTELSAKLAAIRTAREGAAALADKGFSAALTAAGLSTGELDDLQSLIDAGRAITRRLAQICLDAGAYQYLSRVYQLVSANQNVAEPEWTEVYSILLEAGKQRSVLVWRDGERTAGIALGPDCFQLPKPAAIQFPPPLPAEPPRWRASLNLRQVWEDKLQARLDQDAALTQALEQAVDTTEETSLPQLRDALIQAIAVTGPGNVALTGLAQKAEALGDRLLIELQGGGCAWTTRVAQAIETIQNLLFSIRTGQLLDIYPTWKLTQQANAGFDAIWIWLGSYATWRAAMFVLLYPENLLAPSLRRERTPAFNTLLQEVRSTNQLSGQNASAATSEFVDYLRDICQLNIAASPEAVSAFLDEGQTFPGSMLTPVRFLFGVSSQSRRLYWSIVYRGQTDEIQSSWKLFEQFKKDVTKVLGASVYKVPDPNVDKRYLYVFATTNENNEDAIYYARFDLRGEGRWLPAEAEQLDTSGSKHFTAELLSTAETVPPAVRITPDSGNPVEVQLGVDGLAASVQVTQTATPVTWSDAKRSFLLGAYQTLRGGMALRKGTAGSLDDLVLFDLSTWDDAISFYGHIRIAHGLTPAGEIGDQGSWSTIGPDNPAWTFGVDSAPPSGCAIAIADVDGDGQDDLIIVYVSPGDPSSVYCRLGLGLSAANVAADGTPQPAAQQWVDAAVPMFADAIKNTGPCTVAFLGRTGASFDLLVAGVGGSDRKSLWLRKVSVTLANGNTEMNFANARSYSAVPAAANEITGLGLAVADLDGDGKRDLLLHYVEKLPSGTVSGWLRYASTLDADGFPTGQWGSPVQVDSKLYQPIVGTDPNFTDFSNPASAGLAVGSLSASPGKMDAVIASFPGDATNPLPDYFQYLVAGGINLQLVTNPGQSPNTSRYKPNLVSPLVPGSFDYQIGPERTVAVNLTAVWNANANKTRINQVLLEEAFVFAPLAIALQLQRSGDYLAALDWFRVVFDYTAPVIQRVLYPGLEPNPGGSGIWRASNWAWLQDPLDPHSIAQGRNGTYRRYALLAIVHCLLDYADAEFTRDTSESISLARTLYLTALELLDDADLKQTYNNCEAFIDELTFIIGDLPDPTSTGTKGDLITLFGSEVTFADLTEVALPLNSAHDRGYMTASEAAVIQSVVEKVQARQQAPLQTVDEMFSEQKVLESRLNQAVLSDQAQMQEMTAVNAAVAQAVDGALGVLFGQDGSQPGITPEVGTFGGLDGVILPGGGYTDPYSPGGVGFDGTIFGGFLDTLPGTLNILPWSFSYVLPPVGVIIPGERTNPQFTPAPPMLSITTCVPPNPVLRALRLRAELNLFKLRTCRSITGELQQVEPYAAPTDTRSGMPSIGSGGQLVLPGLATLSPTPYRFSVLIERAKSLVQLAQQTENAMLAALQAGDTEQYNAMKARQDLDSAKANVKLQSLRIHEAESSIVLTQLQQQRAQLEIDQYNEWLSAGLSTLEQAALIIEAAGVVHLHVAAAITEATTWGIGGIGEVGNALIATAALLQNMASFERRQQGWVFQRNLAQQDLKIATQQTYIGQDQLRVVTQEQTIASLGEDHASATIEFLARKFTNTDLYDWMAGVLSGVYRYLLQQATGMARLAASQLAFERQEAPPPFILADYWTPPSDEGGSLSGNNQAPDRRGLTGSARLLQDITQLDQYAFTSDSRKLQLSKTISIAQMAPLEFQRFRETGVLTFGTPLEIFDRDFPGHYLRLVHRVKVSVIALIPPAQGIRATLTANRISRVVIGGDLFQTVRVSHGPDLVALSSPRDATGLFELDIQPAMLAPFENIGVDTTWELRLPRAANPFDFDSIADVLFTVDYTAMHSFDYQQQVLQRLGRRVSARRGWSFRDQFADQWYDLNNPDQTPTPMTVQLSTARDDFPANVESDSLTIDDVALQFVRQEGAHFELPNVRLRFQEAGATGFVGGTAGTQDGTISTTSGAAGSWTTMQTKAPIGTWELSLPDSDEIRNRFQAGDIQDILLVVTYSGRTPEWPA